MNWELKKMIGMQFKTQYDFAAEIGIDYQLVSKVVRGRKRLSEPDKVKWASALNCKVRDIFK